MDIGMNKAFNVKLTPKDDEAVYRQNSPLPIHLKEDRIVELALMHNYGIITELSFPKNANAIFVQRKPNGNLRLLVELRKINILFSDDYTNFIHPVSTLSDAAQHFDGKFVFYKLDCSQVYHCRWRTNGQWKRWYSVLLAELHTKDFNNVSADI